MNTKITIAIDGHASCGKSTLAKDLARTLGYIYIDSGAMYRAVTLYVLEQAIPISDTKRIVEALPNIRIHFEQDKATKTVQTYLNGRNVEKEIRSPKVSDQVSPVSTIKEVRAFLVAQQQAFGKHKGITMDGRDIGTVVFPDAELKLFLTASIAVRAQRRFKELQAKGMPVSLADIQQNLEQRDFLDSTRAESPLKQAADAIVIDNSDINQQEQLTLALQYANEQVEKACLCNA